MSERETPPVEHDLIRSAACVALHVLAEEVTPTTDDDSHVCIELRVGTEGEEDEADVEFAAFGLIYVLGVLSFADASPRGNSTIDFAKGDEWTAADMLRHLRFERGALRFYADYVRGRMMKTEIVVRANGTVKLVTTNRGAAAKRWIERLQGKPDPAVVPGDEGLLN